MLTKIFAIRDESVRARKDLAYLFYYEIEKLFYIELPEHADPWETPLILDSFAKRGETTVDSNWSKCWVQQRIIPPDRQNLGNILRDNGLKEYDEFSLLMLAKGRCSQDSYYLAAISEDELPEEIRNRFEVRIEDVLVLKEYCMLVFFKNAMVKKCNLKPYFEQNDVFRILLDKPHLFEKLKILTGGYGVSWDLNIVVSDVMLYEMGESIPLTASEFKKYAMQNVITSTEAAELLNCSRQNLLDLTHRGKLHPVKSSEKHTLYLKSEVRMRNWQ